MKRRLLFLLRLAFGLGLLAYLVAKKSNPQQILASLAQARFLLLALAFSLHAVGMLILTMRWKMILAGRGATFSIGRLMQYNLVAKFFNHFLPSGFGGDLVRISDTRHIRDGLSGSFAVVVFERLSGIFAMTVFALIASLVRLRQIEKMPVGPIALGIILGMMILLALIATALPQNLLQRIPIGHPWLRKILSALDRVHIVIRDCLKNRPLLAKTLYSAFLLQLNVVVYYYFIGRALGLSLIPFSDYFFTIPILVMVLTIPVSINGLGVRDLIFIQFVALYGYHASLGIAFALVDVLFNLILGAIGGIIYIFRKK